MGRCPAPAHQHQPLRRNLPAAHNAPHLHNRLPNALGQAPMLHDESFQPCSEKNNYRYTKRNYKACMLFFFLKWPAKANQLNEKVWVASAGDSAIPATL